MGLFKLLGQFQEILISHWSTRIANKALAHNSASTKLIPEASFCVHCTEDRITCLRPDGSSEFVFWQDLQKVEILTTSDGPWAPDVFWLLHGSNQGCVIPQGATGDDTLLQRLQELPGLNNQVFINAMGSTSEAIFTCWQK